MMKDAGASIGAVVQNRAPYGLIYRAYLDYMRRGHEESGKPVALVAARQGTGHDDIVAESTAAGYPILDNVPMFLRGVRMFLRGVRALFDYRDFLKRDDSDPPASEARAHGRPATCEAEALQLLADFGLPVASVTAIAQESQAVADHYPVVLKTAAPGILHKSDVGGVVLNIESDAQLQEAYRAMAERLGPEAIIAPMAGDGVEMMLGVRVDPQFGPVVLLGFGGVYAETLKDVQFALPPFSEEHARRCVDRLQLRPMLDGQRGQPPADIDAFCDAAAKFSVMVSELRDSLKEVDVNPIIVHESGCTIVDALIVGARPSGR
jgi:hypothetical protein